MAHDHKFGIFYVITRIVLAILTLIAIIALIIGIIYWLDNKWGKSTGYIIWACVALVISICGFYGAWKEHFMSVLIYAIGELIIVLAGISFAEMQLYTRLTQILAIVAAFIFSWMLYVGGRVDYSLPCTA